VLDGMYMCRNLDAWTQFETAVGDQIFSWRILLSNFNCMLFISALLIPTLSSECEENLDRTGS
jgi:hypothetical protein